MAGVILALGLMAQPVLGGERPVRIRVASGATSIVIPILFQKPEILRHLQRSYVPDFVFFAGSSPQIQALGARELDIAWLAFASFPLAILNAKLDLRITADLIQETKDSYSAVRGVLEPSSITRIEDLKGKRIGIIAFGTGSDLGTRAMLKRHGLEYLRDYRLVEVRPPNMEAMLREGKIDLAWFDAGFWHRAQGKGGIRPLFRGTDIFGTVQVLVQVARQEFLSRNREVVIDFYEDYLRGLRWALDGTQREEVIKLAARYFKLPEAAMRGYYLTKADYYRDPDGIPNIEVFQKDIDLMHEMGVLPQKFDAGRYLDLSYIKEARRRLN
ncbi:MAG: ABC transporter substrate-binding protein [Deltaproteobacteria bacterium]|nr:ABC transporter substrate-binding protein [Deltaproteobacteria bacterium]